MSELSDGFGSLSEVEQILADEDEFFHRIAARPDVPYSEDAVQEARIAAWRSLTEHPESRAYMNIAARRRVSAHLYRDQWFGQLSRHGGVHNPVDPLRRRTGRDSIDDPDFGDLEAVDGLSEVLLAYHYGDIMAAVNRLTPAQREYVYYRFWGGYTNVEIAAMRGVTPGSLGAMWSARIKPVLVESLGFLQDAI